MKMLATIGAIQGIILLLFFLSVKKNSTANYNLIVGLLLSVLQILIICYVENPFEASGNLYLKLLTRLLVFPIPVFFYFYIQFITHHKKQYQIWDLLHAVPTILAFLTLLPYFDLNTTSEAVLMNQTANNFAQEGFTMMLFQSMAIVFYAKISFYSIYDYKQKAFYFYSNLDTKEIQWLHGIILSIFAIGTVGMLSSFLGFISIKNTAISLSNTNTKQYVYLVLGVISLSFYWISYKAIRQPEIFRAFEDLNVVVKKEKYSHSIISEAYVIQLAQQLKSLMDQEQLFLDPNLKLSDVAAKMQTTNKILSQLLNQFFEQKFYDFVNAYRIEVAKQKLIDLNFAHLSIQGIALESGFKSKSTFYSLFKKQTGLTPTKYQNNHKMHKNSP